MSPPVLCVIQARYHSQRLPAKMLCTLTDPVHGEETLIARAWRLAGEAFGAENVVVAYPWTDISGPLDEELRRLGARTFPALEAEADVLGRFWSCAVRLGHTGVIHRWTPDDPFKVPSRCVAVTRGAKYEYPEIGGEAFSFKQLCEAQACTPTSHEWREHLRLNPWLFDEPQAKSNMPPGYTIDTAADYAAAQQRIAREGLGA